MFLRDIIETVKITAITAQQKNSDRVNVMVDGNYRFSLDIFQVADLGIRIGKEFTEEELAALEDESLFGKLYARTLEYCMMRPHSAKEVKDYLWRKTRDTRTKEGKVRKGIPQMIADRVFDRLLAKGYVDDEKFARYWVENRNLRKGTSMRKLQMELQTKGVDRSIVDKFLASSLRSDEDELAKIIEKKRRRYPDEQKLIQYLARQGFDYDTIKTALNDED